MPPVSAQAATEAFRRKSVILAPAGDTDAPLRRRSVVLSPISNPVPRNGEYFPNQAGIRRHWHSLRDHAEYVQNGGLITPDIDDRREGFNWDLPYEVDMSPDQHPRMPSAREPKGTARSWRQDSSDVYRNGSITISTPLSRSSTIDQKVIRTDTGFSSISTLDKGVRRAVPDIRMFDPDTHEPPTPQTPILPTPEVKSTRTLSFKLSSAMKKGRTEEGTQKRAQFSETIKSADSSSPDRRKGGLKDRRKLKEEETLKLTLPLDNPNVHSRGRSPVPKTPLETAGLAPPRKRSPKTPWVRDAPAFPDDDDQAQSHTMENPAHKMAEAGVLVSSKLPLKTKHPVSKVRGRNGNEMESSDTTGPQARTTEGTTAAAEDSTVNKNDTTAPPGDVLTQVGGKRPKRWRFIGGRFSSGVYEADTAGAANMGLFLGRIFKMPRKRHSGLKEKDYMSAGTHTCLYPEFHIPKSMDPNARTESVSKKVQIANLPKPPPIFTPPGLSRIPTPPMDQNDDGNDDNDDVKGALEGFYFDVLDVRRSKPSKTALGGIWDSDALLMPQKGFEPEESSSDESPQAPPSHVPTPSPVEDTPSFPPTYMSPPHFTPRAATPQNKGAGPMDSQNAYFRVRLTHESSAEDQLDEEERAKFEWLVPDHLPTSPLCPLHAKYRGPLTGTCLYHEAPQRESRKLGRHSPAASESPATTPCSALEPSVAKKRRLVSLSSP